MAGSELKPNWLSHHEQKYFQNIDFVVRSETAKKEVSKIPPKQKSSSWPRTFFFDVFPNFFSLAVLGNRFRLADLGGEEPLRKFRQKLVLGTGFKKSQEILNCLLEGQIVNSSTVAAKPNWDVPMIDS